MKIAKGIFVGVTALILMAAMNSSSWAAGRSTIRVQTQFELRDGASISGGKLAERLNEIISTADDVLDEVTQRICVLSIERFTASGERDLVVGAVVTCVLRQGDDASLSVQIKGLLKGQISRSTGVLFDVSGPRPLPGGTVHT